MTIGKVLQRSWHIVWHYRALWVAGIILALTAGSLATGLIGWRSEDNPASREWGWTVTGGQLMRNPVTGRWQVTPLRWHFEPSAHQFSRDLQEFRRDLAEFQELGRIWPALPTIQTIITAAIIVAAALLLLFIVGRIARYVADASLIRAVDEYETTGQKRTMGQGLKLGWSRTGWRFFLIDLAIDVPGALAAWLLLGLAFLPLLPVVLNGTPAFPTASVALSAVLFVLAIALIAVGAVALSILKTLSLRACALENIGALAGIRRGLACARHRLGDVALMWLLEAGLRIGLFVALIPVFILLSVLAGLVAGVLGLATFGLAALIWTGVTPWIVAGLVAGSAFIVLLTAPLAFLGGLLEILVSSAWTLTYREAHAPQGVAPQPASQRDLPKLGTAAVS